ncbi:AlpA family transcriptional regulator [Vibrio crassostreae]|uniref:AlpA family transcriptional regulator n=1 Tax=Vibrio crassostreae TaxID=246167 RepID=UPI000632D6D9|nr:AlpA family transcriptional regulator [Vibrio crassostreae]TCT49703.1 AlpA family transcriptional regulator [Vibrio crassostreae]TCT74806.1 AlpA family transcriptional regulator [Vibrio crassostreae]TCT94586.1 AlpA family transcriptional regulator [Vibrio crassostreae]CAK2300417.1 prophage regulatory protein [Vibrio crassostreae]CAK2420123.1 prophage regulatory protein [Vibrio crassostreae]
MKFLRLKDVMEKTGLSRSAIYSQIKEGEFPTSVPIGSRTVAWIDSDVEKWLEWRVLVRNRANKGLFN